jgi:uncharacterized protein YcaQ
VNYRIELMFFFWFTFYDALMQTIELQTARRFIARPALGGDRFVTRFYSWLDRSTNTVEILGFWLEEKALARETTFAEALARDFVCFVRFLEADRMEVRGISEPLLRKRVSNMSS